MMSYFRRVGALVHARNLEFVRDKGTLGWNILMPLLLVAGLGFVLSGEGRPLFKIAVAGEGAHPVSEIRYADIVSLDDSGDSDDALQTALDRLSRHQYDLVADIDAGAYWVNDSAPKGYVLQAMVAGMTPPLQQRTVSGDAVRYIDWLLPGILGMNMMFSCLFGVGYVIVRYRKSGYLKRLHATPTSALEFMSAQVVSRLLLVMTVTVLVYAAAQWIIGFRMIGSHLLLLLITVLGAASLVALGLLTAARVSSEELANGLLNLLTWPMMIVSGVWFSIEGSPAPIQWLAQAFPLTHLLEAARAVMLDGAGLLEVADHLIIMVIMTGVFLLLGASAFVWRDGR